MSIDKKTGALMSRRELARELGISEPTAIRYDRMGLLPKPALCGGGVRRWARADVERIVNGTMVDAKGDAK